MAPVTRPILVDEDFGNRHDDDDADVDHDDDGEGEEDDCDGGDEDDCDEFKAFHYFSLPYALPSSFQEELQHLTIIPLNTNTLSFRQQTNHHHHHRAIGGW